VLNSLGTFRLSALGPPRADVTQRLTISGIYDLPFGKGQTFLSNSRTVGLVSGWQYTGVLTLESGRPIGISGANNQLATRPDWNPGVRVKVNHAAKSTLYKTRTLEWFNPQAFVNPLDYTFGNIRPFSRQLRGPGTSNLDMSLIKSTHLTERTVIEFRIEAYDALNHHNLSSPDGSFVAGPPADASNPYAEGGHNTSSTFGMISSTNSSRTVQFATKISF
jgi:hypothetical protein